MATPITLAEVWQQMIDIVGGSTVPDSELREYMLAFATAIGSGGGVGPGYVNVFDFLSGGEGTSAEVNAAILEIGGPTGPGGVIDLSGGQSQISYNGPLTVPSNSEIRLAGPGVTVFNQAAGYQGDCFIGPACGNPAASDQYITFKGGGTWNGSFTGKVLVAQQVYLAASSNQMFPGHTPQTITVYGDINQVNYLGLPTGFVATGGIFYSSGSLYTYTGVSGAPTGPATAPTAGSKTTPFPINYLLGCIPYLTGTTSLKKNGYLIPYTAGANAIGSGIRMQGNRVKLSSGYYNMNGMYGDGYGLWGGTSNIPNSCAGDTLIANQCGGAGYANYNAADCFWERIITDGCGFTGVFSYASDHFGRTLHSTNGPSSSAFTPGLISGGEKHQTLEDYSCDGQLGGAVYIENGRHAANPSEGFHIGKIKDLQNTGGFPVISGNDPLLVMDALASTSNPANISNVLVTSCVEDQSRCAVAASSPVGALVNTLTAPSNADAYFVSLLSYILDVAGVVMPTFSLPNDNGIYHSITPTYAQCVMGIGETVKSAGVTGIGSQGTTGVITLNVTPDVYGFFGPFITGKNAVVPDPNTFAPVFLNNITVSTNGLTLTGTWGPNTVVGANTTGTYVSGNTITVASAANIAVGMAVTDTTTAAHIVSGTTVTLVSGTTVTLSTAPSATFTNDALIFSANAPLAKFQVSQCYMSGFTSASTFIGQANVSGVSNATSAVINAVGHGLKVGTTVNVVGVQYSGGVTTTGTYSGTGNTITVASATNITVGQIVTDTTNPGNIPSLTQVIGVSGTTVTLANTPSAAFTGTDTLVFAQSPNGTWPIIAASDSAHLTIPCNTEGMTIVANTGSVQAACYPVPGSYAANVNPQYALWPTAWWTLANQNQYIPNNTDVHWENWQGTTNPLPHFNTQPPSTTVSTFAAGGLVTPASMSGISVGQLVTDSTNPGALSPGTIVLFVGTTTLVLLPAPLEASAGGGDTLNFSGDNWTWGNTSTTVPTATSGLNATSLQGEPISGTTPTTGQGWVFNGTSWVPTTQTDTLFGVGGVLVGSAPPAGTGFLKQAGIAGISFTSGVGTLTFPESFPLGVVTVEANLFTGLATQGSSCTLLQGGTFSTSAVQLYATQNGTSLGSSYQVAWVAWGF